MLLSAIISMNPYGRAHKFSMVRTNIIRSRATPQGLYAGQYERSVAVKSRIVLKNPLG